MNQKDDRFREIIESIREQHACADYKRPEGVLGGPCLNCGKSQPEHVKKHHDHTKED